MLLLAWILILVGLAFFVYIVVKKFPQVANIDVESLPQEKEARKKKEILSRRIVAERGEFMHRLFLRLAPVREWWSRTQSAFRRYVGRVERLWHHEEQKKTAAVPPPEKKVPVEPAEDKTTMLLRDGRQQLEQGDFEKAEAAFIAIIKLEPHSALAYRGLADTYLAQGSLAEAEETYQFLRHLTPNDDMVFAKLGEVEERRGNKEKAIEYYQQAVVLNDSLSPRFFHLAELLVQAGQATTAKEAIVQAVELEPANRTYLDLLAEIGVLCGDKDLIEQAYTTIRAAHPDDPKLSELLEQMKKIQ